MEANDSLEEQFREKEQYCRTISSELAAQFPSILAIALIGGCARGVAFPEDIDFLIIVRDAEELQRLQHRLKDFEINDKNNYSLIYYTVDNLKNLVTQRKSNLRTVHLARWLTRLLRHLPFLKKILIRILGSRRTFFQMQEVLPQSFQTAIPLQDKEDILSIYQHEQEARLREILPHWEKQFYSPYGFHKLMKGYLSGDVDPLTVQSILFECDIESHDYVERLARYYDTVSDPVRSQRCRAIFQHSSNP